LKQEQNIHGVAVVSAEQCPYVTIRTESFQIKNLSNSSLKKPKYSIYAVAQEHKLRPTVTAAITVSQSDGYRNRT
jgi:hypothetical protein